MAITDVNDGEVLTGTIWQSVIDTVEDTSTGHDHDGTDSKYVVNFEESSHLTNITNGNSATETEMGEIIINANECKVGALAIAVIDVGHHPDATFTGRIRTGTNATATSNTERVQITHADNTYGAPRSTMTLMWWCNEETLSAQWYIHVTGQYSDSEALNDATIKSFVAIKF